MLNNPLKYLRRKWTMQSTDDELHCIRYSLLVPVPPFLPIGICGSKSHQEPPYRTASFRVSETGCAINEGFVCSGIPVSCISFQSTCGIELLIKCSERVHPFFQEQSYCGSERRHRWLPMQAQAVCTEYNAVRRHADDLSIFGVST